MATYTIPQNVEAEDKLIGPFSFKQFIFLIIAVTGAGIGFLLYRIQPFLVVIPLPVVLVFGVLGIYHREDQPVETYLMAALNFFIKPRRRLWNTEGLIENVRLTAPKRYVKPRLKQLGAQEHSQLERLARIIDTHGWSTKRPELTLPSGSDNTINADDRLVVPANTQSQEPLDVYARDDILDTYNNPAARDYADLAQSTTGRAKQQAIAKMQAAKAAVQPDYLRPAAAAPQQPGKNTPTAPDLRSTNTEIPKYDPYPTMKQTVIGPSGQTQRLAKNNDLSVSQIAKQAQTPKA